MVSCIKYEKGILDCKLTGNSPLMKDQLYTGDWSVLILSNNGDADPIAYERDFYLSVGIPATVTVCGISLFVVDATNRI